MSEYTCDGCGGSCATGHVAIQGRHFCLMCLERAAKWAKQPKAKRRVQIPPLSAAIGNLFDRGSA